MPFLSCYLGKILSCFLSKRWNKCWTTWRAKCAQLSETNLRSSIACLESSFRCSCTTLRRIVQRFARMWILWRITRRSKTWKISRSSSWTRTSLWQRNPKLMISSQCRVPLLKLREWWCRTRVLLKRTRNCKGKWLNWNHRFRMLAVAPRLKSRMRNCSNNWLRRKSNWTWK